MDINELIIELQKIQSEGKGDYIVRAHNIHDNSSCNSPWINENQNIDMSEIKIEDESKTITFGKYYEYCSY